MYARKKTTARVLISSLALATGTLAQAGSWAPLPPQTLEIKPGSALDFSNLAPTDSHGDPVPAGEFGPVRIDSQGKFVFAKKPGVPIRFFAASLGVSPASGSFPDAAASRRLARQFKLAGYNLVRLHMVDAVLMNKTGANLVFDAVQLDRLHFLLAALKKEGIYWMFDGMSSAKGGYSNSIVDKNKDQWAPSPFNVKTGLYVSDVYRSHYKDLVKKIFATINPYTNISIIDDPALAGIILVNEGGIDFAAFQTGSDIVRASMVGSFNRWLKSKYGTTTELRKSWGGAGPEKFDPATESLEKENVRLPTDIYSATARNIDAQKFFLDLEAAAAKWMTAFFRDAKDQGGLGYNGPLTSLNNWTSLQANLSRSQFPWVDLHMYFDEPSRFADTGSTIRGVSSLYDPDPKRGPDGAPQRSLGYMQALAANRHVGKPFSVSEYGHVFWSPWRREGMAFAAYASLQDWDMICQFNEPVILSSRNENSAPPRHRAIYPYDIGLDPIAKATETLAALLFLRGDVATARNTVVFKINLDNFQPPNNSMGAVGGLRHSIAGLSLISRLGVVVEPNEDATAVGTPGKTRLETLRSTQKAVAVRGTETIDQMIDSLSVSGVIPRSALSSFANSVYESDTKQLVLRARERSFVVTTPRTEAVSFDAKIPAGLKHLRVDAYDTPALVALSSIDGLTLDNSKRMLLTVSTDAINSGMTFRVTEKDGAQTIKAGEDTDASERKVLQKLGQLPVLLKTTRMTLRIKNRNFRSLAVYALALNGERMAKLSQSIDSAHGEILLDIDTEKTLTTYFEITVSENDWN